MSVYVKFSRPREEVEGPIFGPFEWVQITYDMLRVGPDGMELAAYDSGMDEWYLDADGEPWSDIIIYPEPIV